MQRVDRLRPVSVVILLFGIISTSRAVEVDERDLSRGFEEHVLPFLTSYCLDCHGGEEPEAMLDLARFGSFADVRADLGHWETVRDRLVAGEMPPDEAEQLPTAAERQMVIDWIIEARRFEAERNAGDPGPVLPRRLSNAEYNYTIRDLTGVDIRPTREFPIDPANESGFDNTGESLTMSPALLQKYLAAARFVADHLVLLPDGFTFAPHPAVTDTDRDKFCVSRIIDFYSRQHIDYADYFHAAWRYEKRVLLGQPDGSLTDVATNRGISPDYLAMIYAALTSTENDAGPMAELREQWDRLTQIREGQTVELLRGCRRMRDFVIEQRRTYAVPIGSFQIDGVNRSSQPLVLSINNRAASNRRRGKLPEPDGELETERLRAAIEEFCWSFPDTFLFRSAAACFSIPRIETRVVT